MSHHIHAIFTLRCELLRKYVGLLQSWLQQPLGTAIGERVRCTESCRMSHGRQLSTHDAANAGCVAKGHFETAGRTVSCSEQERAESMERVLAVDLLHLMAAEGSHGAQIAQQLDASEVWHAYRDQKHDLFLPAGATSQVNHNSPCTRDQT